MFRPRTRADAAGLSDVVVTLRAVSDAQRPDGAGTDSARTEPAESRVAWVTGASRGVAVALGRAGWTVYLTARSGAGGERTSHLPGTVEETAADVTAAGGQGIGIVCDHRDDAAITAVAARIQAERGRRSELTRRATVRWRDGAAGAP